MAGFSIDFRIYRVFETVKPNIGLACLKKDIRLKIRAFGCKSHRFLKSFEGFRILGLSLGNGPAELQAALLEQG